VSGGGGGVISEGGGVRLKSSPPVSTGDVCVYVFECAWMCTCLHLGVCVLMLESDIYNMCNCTSLSRQFATLGGC